MNKKNRAPAKIRQIDWSLCFIADSQASGGRDVLWLIEEAVAGGATIVQLRGKTWTVRNFLRLAVQAVELVRPKGIPLIINDRADIALACRADGVHLGQDDLPVSEARKILGQDRLIGISINTPEEARRAEEASADYAGAGPVFATLSKPDLQPLLGLEGLRRIRTETRLPILAIGGITLANVGEVMAAGADGVAVISAIASAASPRQASTKFIETIGKVRKNPAPQIA
ncbi:MAG: thiamine phosphate synthase [Clostridiales bacterium]|nr:thiamine phosphate synthase [Clostridiales bacterium]